ncbi:unnamed protein product [Durusdinium trenchii]|uniref:Protein kinase domain-containing protein n=1 Tax=Durusdinium trenchii TaxID=1381693 RepID=A0ABP0KQZ8_9DINO
MINNHRKAVFILSPEQTSQPAELLENQVKIFVRQADDDGPQVAFHNEKRMLQLVSHPNVISLIDAFEDARGYQLVVEFCSGGELFDKVIDDGNLTEKQAAMLMRQICSPLAYMHKQHVCHRDLKPEHFLLGREGPLNVVPLSLELERVKNWL